jgi:hypothetical protein
MQASSSVSPSASSRPWPRARRDAYPVRLAAPGESQLGRKEGMEETPYVFRKSLDADIAHLLWPANVFP